MEIERESIQADGYDIPCVIIKSPVSKGAAVIVHGYGGCKEEQLGFAWRVAAIGITTYTIDLRGHGEHALSLDENVLLDVETVIKHCHNFDRVAAIGHSLGGRLCLISSADFTIGISPALESVYGAETQRILNYMRNYRVRESFAGVNYEILKKLPAPQSIDHRKSLILFGSRDVPEIVSACRALKANDNHVVEIEQALHNDIFLLEETYRHVQKQLMEWFRAV